MADLAGITAVRPTADTQTSKVVYGATIPAGEPVYKDAADRYIEKCPLAEHGE